MTQDDIKKLALLSAKEAGWYIKDEQIANDSVELCERFLAAYLAEQEPVATVGMDYTGAYILHGAPDNLQQGTKLFTARPLPDTAPQEGTTRPAAPPARETPVGAAPLPKEVREMTDGWALYCVKCLGPVPSEFSTEQRDKDWSAFKGAAPLPEEVQWMSEWLREDCWHDAARLLERLAAENAALTQERDDLKDDYLRRHKDAVDRWEQLAASQAREAKLREALAELARGKFPKDGDEFTDDSMRLFAGAALAFPTDDTALRERLEEERERCAQRVESIGKDIVCPEECAAAIRSMK